MARFMRPYSAQTYALMRIVVGFLFFWHGSQKILGFPPYPPEVAEQVAQAPPFIIWTSALIEFAGGLGVMVGLFTRWAAFLSSGLMAFAFWIGHGFKGLSEQGLLGLLPINNQGELAALYCFVFLYIASRGGGMWSFDGGE